MSLLRFLEHRIGSAIGTLDHDDDGISLFENMASTISACNAFLKCLYSTALWLTPDERDVLLQAGHATVKGFHQCATFSYDRGETRWKFQPKIHMFGEVLHALESQRKKKQPSISPLTWSTQVDEDFVGRISNLSSMVSVRTVHDRTIGRYQIALASKW